MAARPRGALERDVLACLAAAGRPLTPAQVRAELGVQLAYTTVMTTLSRLHTKGAVTRHPAGRGFSYELSGGPTAAQASMTAHRMHQLLETGSDRVGVLSRFVADLSPEDEQLLLGLLANSDQDTPAARAAENAVPPGSEPPQGAA